MAKKQDDETQKAVEDYKAAKEHWDEIGKIIDGGQMTYHDDEEPSPTDYGITIHDVSDYNREHGIEDDD